MFKMIGYCLCLCGNELLDLELNFAGFARVRVVSYAELAQVSGLD